MNIQIREATQKDLPSILSLYAQPDMDDEHILSPDVAKHILKRMKNYPDYKVYVALTGEDIIGTFALLIMDNLAHMGTPSGVIEDVVVSTDYQGKGTGKKMMEFALERCREKGCYKVMLSSNLKREKAHVFYESLGFKKHGYSFIADL